MQGANVTFDAPVTTPSRAGSPEPKRALSTHNIQRLARKISLSSKSPKLPGVLRRGTRMRDASMASSVAGGSASMPPASGSARESMDEPQIKVVSKKEEKRTPNFGFSSSILCTFPAGRPVCFSLDPFSLTVDLSTYIVGLMLSTFSEYCIGFFKLLWVINLNGFPGSLIFFKTRAPQVCGVNHRTVRLQYSTQPRIRSSLLNISVQAVRCLPVSISATSDIWLSMVANASRAQLSRAQSLLQL
ncbi:hypothetical protein EDB19DRAFT_505883 [Suillus lakei]|nr:hypothetical protein EDB19DRAFT_505883 [Suillus lakei]